MQHSSTSASRRQTIERLFESTNTLKRGMYAHLQAGSRELPIPRSQVELLMTIRHLQLVNFKDLAKQLCLTPGAVSQLAEGLETAGLIQRETDQADRRIVSLSVTRKGAALLQDIEKHRRKLMEAMMEDLSDDELELWLRLQEKMIARFQAETTNSKQE